MNSRKILGRGAGGHVRHVLQPQAERLAERCLDETLGRCAEQCPFVVSFYPRRASQEEVQADSDRHPPRRRSGEAHSPYPSRFELLILCDYNPVFGHFHFMVFPNFALLALKVFAIQRFKFNTSVVAISFCINVQPCWLASTSTEYIQGICALVKSLDPRRMHYKKHHEHRKGRSPAGAELAGHGKQHLCHFV